MGAIPWSRGRHQLVGNSDKETSFLRCRHVVAERSFSWPAGHARDHTHMVALTARAHAHSGSINFRGWKIS